MDACTRKRLLGPASFHPQLRCNDATAFWRPPARRRPARRVVPSARTCTAQSPRDSAGKIWAEYPATQTPRLEPGESTHLLGFCRLSPTAYSDPIPAAHDPRTGPTTTDRPVQNGHRTATAGQIRVRRGASARFPPDPRRLWRPFPRFAPITGRIPWAETGPTAVPKPSRFRPPQHHQSPRTGRARADSLPVRGAHASGGADSP